MTLKITKAPARRQNINASRSVTSGVRNRRNVTAASLTNLTESQRAFVRQLRNTATRYNASITAATNTSNIMARPDFLELLPMFVQKLLILDVFGSVAMRSRQQLIPYFKFIAENTKGETKAGTVLSSPFVNRQGVDANFTGRVVKNEVVAEGGDITGKGKLVYLPVLPGSVTIKVAESGVVTSYIDDGNGLLLKASDNSEAGTIDYSVGEFELTQAPTAAAGNSVSATYQYDNENVGPNAEGKYGAQMAKGYLQLDEINLVAEARELACYWSIYSAFAAQQEYGSNVGDIAKEAAVAELVAEINSTGFRKLKEAASYNPQFNWDGSPVMSGSVVPSDYLNMFKLKLGQASASIYQATRLSRPNRLVVGTNTAEYITMINGFSAAPAEENVGPYKLGTLDQFEIYVDPNYDPNEWVMCCKNSDIRRNSGLFGEYMPITNTDPITLANASSQQGYATMFACEVVNPKTVVSGKIVGLF